MVHFYKSHVLSLSLLVFLVFNIVLYIWILSTNNLISFSRRNYINNAHHYIEDQRIHGDNFHLLQALGQYDAQWYLKIADQGYPSRPALPDLKNKHEMDGLTYAFFPLYPLILSFFDIFFQDIEPSAFIVSNICMLANAILLFFIINKLATRRVATKTVALLFLFPLSIFYRSYFTEGIYLFLLLLFCSFLFQKKYLFATISLSLINITKANGWLLNVLLLYYLWRAYKKGHISFRTVLFLIMILCLPTLGWMVFCYLQTGDPFTFLSIRSAWSTHGLLAVFYNIKTVFLFPWLPVHSFHSSQLDVLFIILISLLLFLSYKKIPRIFWWISFCLWLSPLLVTDTMSFSRYQVVSFPLFFYLSKTLPTKYYILLTVCFFVILLFTSLLFVNWYWVG